MKKILYFIMAMFLCFWMTGCFNTTPSLEETEQEECYKIDSTQLEDDELVEDTTICLDEVVDTIK